MEQSRLRLAGKAFLGLVETFLVLHGGLNLFGQSSLRQTSFAFVVCGGMVLVVVAVYYQMTGGKRTAT